MPVLEGARAFLWGEKQGEHWQLGFCLPASPVSSLGFLPVKHNAAQQGVAGDPCGHRDSSQM